MIGPWHNLPVWVLALPLCIKLEIIAGMSSKLQSDLNRLRVRRGEVSELERKSTN